MPRRDQLIVAAGAAVPLLVWWLGWFPGFLSFDSVDQLGQARSGQIFDFHPAIHTILLRWIGLGGVAPAAVTALQAAGLVALLVAISGRLHELGVPRWAAVAAPAALPWWPAIAQTTLTVWKDIPFALMLLWLFAELLAVAARGVDHLRRHPIRFGLVLAGVWLLRHNGFITVLGLIAVMALVYRRAVPWTKVVGALAAALFIVLGPIYWIYDVDRSRPATSEIMIGDVAAAYLNTNVFEPDDVSYLSAIARPESWAELYDCDDSNPILFDGRFNKQFIRQDGNRFLARGLEAWGQALPTVLGHRFCAASYLYLPNQPADAYLHRPPFAVPDNDLGIVREPIVTMAYDVTFRVFQWVEPADRLWLTFRPALPFIAALVVGAYVWATKPRRWRWPFALMAIHFVNVFMTSLNQEFRFAYPLYMMALLVLPLSLVRESRARE